MLEVTVDDDGMKQLSEMAESPWEDAEIVVRTFALLKLPFTDNPLATTLDLRLRDYGALPSPDAGAKVEKTATLALSLRGRDFAPDDDTVFPTNAAQARIAATGESVR